MMVVKEPENASDLDGFVSASIDAHYAVVVDQALATFAIMGSGGYGLGFLKQIFCACTRGPAACKRNWWSQCVKNEMVTSNSGGVRLKMPEQNMNGGALQSFPLHALIDCLLE